MRTDDQELVRQTLAGEPAAFALLVDRYRDMVYGAAFYFLQNREEAQDAAQEAFVHAYAQLRDLGDPGKLSPWLRRITLRECLDRKRRAGRLRAQQDEAARMIAASSDSQFLERLTTRLMVQDALGRLSDKTRLTVTLFYLSGYSHAEIARFLEVPVNTVRSRLLSAKRQLREEMITMVDEIVNEGRPNPAWARQVAQEALRRGDEALHSYQRGEAVRHADEALTVIERMKPGAEQTRLKMQALWQKGTAVELGRYGMQALAIAETLGDLPDQAEKLMGLAGGFYNGGQKPEAENYYQKALDITRQLGDANGQARCLANLGVIQLWGDVTRSRPLFEQALTLFEAAGNLDASVYCRAVLNVMAKVGPENLQKIIGYYAGSDVLKQSDGIISHPSETCYISYTWTDDLLRSPLKIQRVFWQCSHLNKMLDAAAPVGESWSGSAFSHSSQPLQVTAAVLSKAERVVVPAGSFDSCLLTEQITTESRLPDDAPEERKQANREEFCGIRRAWYAPGVGLARLHVRRGDGLEACLQLQSCAVAAGSGDYLPLAVGNAWTYGWADVPPEYAAKEAYQVTARKDDLWYLEHFAYARRQEDES